MQVATPFLIACGGTKAEQLCSEQYVRFGVSNSIFLAKNCPMNWAVKNGLPTSMGMGRRQHFGGNNAVACQRWKTTPSRD